MKTKLLVIISLLILFLTPKSYSQVIVEIQDMTYSTGVSITDCGTIEALKKFDAAEIQLYECFSFP